MKEKKQPILKFEDGTLVLFGWTQREVSSVFGDELWTWDSRIEGWRCESRAYHTVKRRISQHLQQNLQDHTSILVATTLDLVPAWEEVEWPKPALPELREEQELAIHAWLKGCRGVIVMPTGSGKTEVALGIMSRAGCSTLIVAPIRDLMYQWHQRILRGLGYDAGILGDNTFNVRPVTVTTYDSACIHMAKLGNRFECIIFDECHHLPGVVRSDAARMAVAPLRLGLTATPERRDRKHLELGHLIGPEVYRLGIQQIRGKTLAEYEIFRIPIHLTESEQKRYEYLSKEVREYFFLRRQNDANFTWEVLCAEFSTDTESRRIMTLYRQKQAIEDRATEKLRVLEDLFRLHQGAPVIVFAGSNAMARDVSLRFLIPCLLSHCGKKERLDYLEGLRDGVYPAIVANQILDEGVDLPEVKVAVVIGGMGSSKQAKQRLGRILRRSGDCPAVLYEVVCVDTGEVKRSIQRRKSDAYKGTRRRQI